MVRFLDTWKLDTFKGTHKSRFRFAARHDNADTNYHERERQGLRDEFESQQDGWKAVYDATDPEQEPLPGRWAAELTGIRALCTLR